MREFKRVVNSLNSEETSSDKVGGTDEYRAGTQKLPRRLLRIGGWGLLNGMIGPLLREGSRGAHRSMPLRIDLFSHGSVEKSGVESERVKNQNFATGSPA